MLRGLSRQSHAKQLGGRPGVLRAYDARGLNPMAAESASECLARAGAERDLAEVTSLQRVREQHLRSAERWEDLASEFRLRAEAQALIREGDAERRSLVAAERGKKRMAAMTAEERSEAARRAAQERWRKDF